MFWKVVNILILQQVLQPGLEDLEVTHSRIFTVGEIYILSGPKPQQDCGLRAPHPEYQNPPSH